MKNVLILCVLTTFILNQQGLMAKPRVQLHYKINGKVSAEQTYKLSSINNAIQSHKSVKLRSYIVERIDLRKSEKNKGKVPLNSFTIPYLSEGVTKVVELSEFNYEFNACIDNNYAAYDKVFIYDLSESILDETNHPFSRSLSQIIDSLNWYLGESNLKRKINILIYVNVNQARAKEPINCISSISFIVPKYDNITRCRKKGEMEVGYLFIFNINPFDNIKSMELSIMLHGKTVYSESVDVNSINKRGSYFYQKGTVFQYFFTNSKFQAIENMYADYYLRDFQYRIVLNCYDNQKYYSDLSRMFNFGKCPDVFDNLPYCDED